MTEPIEDWNAGGSPLGRELLSTGRVERAPSSTRRRAELAMLAGTGAALTSGVGASAGWLKAGALRSGLKWLLVSALVVGGGGVAVRMLRPHANQSRNAGATARGATPTPAVTPALVESAPQGILITPESDQAVGATRVGGDTARLPERVRSAALPLGSAPEVGGDGRLGREVAALSQARAELSRGAPEQALRILEPGGGKFRILALEAELLRAEALAAAGQRAAARALAQQLLRAHPAGPYAQRLRALAD